MTPQQLQSLRIRYSRPGNPLPEGIRGDVLSLIAEVETLTMELESGHSRIFEVTCPGCDIAQEVRATFHIRPRYEGRIRWTEDGS